MVTLKKILVTTDLSDHSLAALEYASTLCLLYSARLFVLHVEDVQPPAMYGTHVADAEGEEFMRQAIRDSQKDLKEFADLRIDPDLKAELHVRIGDAVKEITKFAADEQVDLIVMATHGRTGLKHVLMGSIAEKVVRHSPVPVLTVKPKGIRDQILSSREVEKDLHMH